MGTGKSGNGRNVKSGSSIDAGRWTRDLRGFGCLSRLATSQHRLRQMRHKKSLYLSQVAKKLARAGRCRARHRTVGRQSSAQFEEVRNQTTLFLLPFLPKHYWTQHSTHIPIVLQVTREQVLHTHSLINVLQAQQSTHLDRVFPASQRQISSFTQDAVHCHFRSLGHRVSFASRAHSWKPELSVSCRCSYSQWRHGSASCSCSCKPQSRGQRQRRRRQSSPSRLYDYLRDREEVSCQVPRFQGHIGSRQALRRALWLEEHGGTASKILLGPRRQR